MSRALKIENFCSINKLELELKQLNIFVCENIQHKEVILKIILFCELLEPFVHDMKNQESHYKNIFQGLFGIPSNLTYGTRNFKIEYYFENQKITIYFDYSFDESIKFILKETDVSLKVEDYKPEIQEIDFTSKILDINKKLKSIGYDKTIKDIYCCVFGRIIRSVNFDFLGEKTRDFVSLAGECKNFINLCYQVGKNNDFCFYLKDFESQFSKYTYIDIINAILMCLNVSTSSRWNLTTYSEYSLFLINNSIDAYQKNKHDSPEGNKLIPKIMLNPDKISVYWISPTGAESLLNTETQLINYDFLL